MRKMRVVKTISLILVVLLMTCIIPIDRSYAAEEYIARDPHYSMTDTNVNRATSEHFQIVWGNNDQTGLVNDAFIQGNLKNLEEMWQLYINELGMAEPGVSIDPRKQDGKKYKTNLYLTRTGLSKHQEGWAFMSGDADGFGFMIIDPAGLRVDPPSWVTPHEFGHVVTMHQKGWTNNNMAGPWWESVANWFREQYLYSSHYQYNGRTYSPDTDFFEPLYKTLNLCSPHGRNYYQAWPILQYLTENPDNYPNYGGDFVKRVMQGASQNEYPYDTIKRLAPEVSLKDTLGNYAKRMATQDFSKKALYTARFNRMMSVDHNKQIVLTQLKKVSDKPGWWRVPIERAPQQTGINIIPLIPQGLGNGRTVTVDFNGLVDSARGSDWRACLVVQDTSGNTRYSSLWNKGTNSVTLSSYENTVYLVVVATPDRIVPLSAFDDERKAPFNSAPSKVRFPYEVQISGAVPFEEKPGIAGRSGSRHPNGGGFVESTAYAAPTAYVGPNAVVLGRARVNDYARIEDFAVVKDNAVISGNAVVSGHALVKERATVKDNAKVRDFAVMLRYSEASGNARVLESAVLSDNYKVLDNGVAKGTVSASGAGVVSGEGVIDGDYADSTNVSKGTAFGWLRGQEFADGRPFTAGMYAGYEFGTMNSVYALDKYGVTHGILRGNPIWTSSSDGHSGVIQFNGMSQYVVLENSVSDLKDIGIQMSVKWDGGAANQRIFSFGSSSEKCMYLTPSDENGKVKFVIRNGANVQSLTGSTALPAGRWADVRVILSGNTGALYVDNNIVAGSTNMTIDPEDLNAPNINSESNSNYIGRGVQAGDPYFKGAVDYFNIYFKTEVPVIPTPVIPTPVIPTPTPTPTPLIKIGDVNGDGSIDSTDYVYMKRYILKIIDKFPYEYGEIAADVNKDGTIDSTDYFIMNRYLLKIIDTF